MRQTIVLNDQEMKLQKVAFDTIKEGDIVVRFNGHGKNQTLWLGEACDLSLIEYIWYGNRRQHAHLTPDGRWSITKTEDRQDVVIAYDWDRHTSKVSLWRVID